MLMELSPNFKHQPNPSEIKISVGRSGKCIFHIFVQSREWCKWPWTWVFSTCGRVGGRVICHCGNILCCGLTKLSLVTSHYYLLPPPFCPGLLTRFSILFPFSHNWRKPSQYEHNKKTQSIHRDQALKMALKGGKKRAPLCSSSSWWSFFDRRFSMSECSVFVSTNAWTADCGEVKVNGFPADKISHFCLLVSFHFCHCVLLCLIVNNMVFVSFRPVLHFT